MRKASRVSTFVLLLSGTIFILFGIWFSSQVFLQKLIEQSSISDAHHFQEILIASRPTILSEIEAGEVGDLREEAISEAALTLDISGYRIFNISGHTVAESGFTPDPLDTELRSPDQIGKSFDSFASTVTTSMLFYTDTSVVGKVVSPILDRGRPIGMLEVFTDKTEYARLASDSMAFVFWIASFAMLGLAFTWACFISQDFSGLNRAMDTLRAKEAEAQIQKRLFNAALENMSQGLAMYDEAHNLMVCNSRYEGMYDCGSQQITTGVALKTLIGANVKKELLLDHSIGPQEYRFRINGIPVGIDEHIKDIEDSLRDKKSYKARYEFEDGRVISVNYNALKGAGWVSTHEDITGRLDSENEIKRLAHNDSLTNLPNRISFRTYLDEYMSRLNRHGTEFAVIMFDLDKFKAVNDELGHQAGDELLKDVAARLKETIRSVDVPARLGGDEFALIAPAGAGNLAEGIETLASRLIDVLSAPYTINNQTVNIGCSVGAALAPMDGADADDLVNKADLALYKSKSEGRNCFHFFDPEMQRQIDDRVSLEKDLQKAIWRDEFELFYQPIIDTHTHRIKLVEALLRWRHPVRGLVRPDEFIPLAEETGLIADLGEWILTRACRDVARMPEEVSVSVNLSPIQFSRSNVVDDVITAIVESQISASRLEVEITETVLLNDTHNNQLILQQLKNLGISVALDDFGVGYSSLSYLTSFSFDKVKIDRSFIDKIDKPETEAVIRSIVQLARSLDLETCAEGVETHAQLNKIEALGIALGQGYLFGKPVPFDELNFEAVMDDEPKSLKVVSR